jgi:hypothetical protein
MQLSALSRVHSTKKNVITAEWTAIRLKIGEFYLNLLAHYSLGQ